MLRVSWTAVIGGVALLVTGFLYYHTFDEAYTVSRLTAGRGPVFYPRILLAAMGLFAVLVIVEGLKEKPVSIVGAQPLVVLGTLGLTGLYILSVTWAGFLISTVVFVFMLPWLLGYRNGPVIAAVAAVYPVVVWYMFEKVFRVILPSSPWFDAF